MNIVLPDHIDIDDQAQKNLKKLGAILYKDVPDEQTLIERIKDAEVITANYVDITKSIINAAPKLKYIVVPAVGYEWVDYAYAKTKGIKVLNCPTHNAQAVAEHAVALMFTVQRKITFSSNALKQGEWNPKKYKGSELASTKLGLVGYGKIGKKIADICKALGMEVVFVDSKSSGEQWKNIFETSDIVCVCLPLTETTKNIVSQELISMMKKSAILVNVGRGATIETQALVNAVKNQDISGAGLDVYENEPLLGDPSKEIVEIAQLSNVVATPHIGYNTEQTAIRLGVELVECISSCLSDSPINVVNF